MLKGNKMKNKTKNQKKHKKVCKGHPYSYSDYILNKVCMEMAKKVQQGFLESDPMQDPFRPDLNSDKLVWCIHCSHIYKEKEVKLVKEENMWYCKHYPKCNGAGVGIDIWRLEEQAKQNHTTVEYEIERLKRDYKAIVD